MKSIIRLLVFCILHQSCNSYRKVDLATEEITLKKKYKLKKINGEKQKLTITQVSDSMIMGYSQKDSSIAFTTANIDIFRKIKFSIIKTIGLSLVIIDDLIGIFLISFKPSYIIGAPNFN